MAQPVRHQGEGQNFLPLCPIIATWSLRRRCNIGGREISGDVSPVAISLRGLLPRHSPSHQHQAPHTSRHKNRVLLVEHPNKDLGVRRSTCNRSLLENKDLRNVILSKGASDKRSWRSGQAWGTTILLEETNISSLPL